MTAPTKAALLLIGDELLTGKIVDENGLFAIRTFRALGIDLGEVRIVGDRPAAIAEAVAALADRYTVVVTSGGIGPTHDDITMAAVATGLGMPLAEHAEFKGWIERAFGNRPAELAVWLRMAMLPAESMIVTGHDLLWPVLGTRNVYSLPGIPQLFRNQLTAIVGRFAAQAVTLRTLFLTSGEGELAPLLEATLAAEPEVAIGSYPVWGPQDHRTRITLESRDGAAVERAVAHLTAAVGEALVRVE